VQPRKIRKQQHKASRPELGAGGAEEENAATTNVVRVMGLPQQPLPMELPPPPPAGSKLRAFLKRGNKQSGLKWTTSLSLATRGYLPEDRGLTNVPQELTEEVEDADLRSFVAAVNAKPEAAPPTHDVAVELLLKHTLPTDAELPTMFLLSRRLPLHQQHGFVQWILAHGRPDFCSPLLVYHALRHAAEPDLHLHVLHEQPVFRFWFAVAALTAPVGADPELGALLLPSLDFKDIFTIFTPFQLAFVVHQLSQCYSGGRKSPATMLLHRIMHAFVPHAAAAKYRAVFVLALWHRGALVGIRSSSTLLTWLRHYRNLLCEDLRNEGWAPVEKASSDVFLPPYLDAFPSMRSQVNKFLGDPQAQPTVVSAQDEHGAQLFLSELDVLLPTVSVLVLSPGM
jgi:hypothetical protein